MHSYDISSCQQATRQVVLERGAKVSVSVFWGRGRYVSILWPYLERNLVANGGIVDEILLITRVKDSTEDVDRARHILESNVAKYPGVVKEVRGGCVRTTANCTRQSHLPVRLFIPLHRFLSAQSPLAACLTKH